MLQLPKQHGVAKMQPVAIDFVMRSFSASSGTISAAPFVIKSSWSSSEANVAISPSIKTQPPNLSDTISASDPSLM
jgi:hypothetical protein